MAKNQLSVSNNKKQFMEVTTILADSGTKAKLQNYIDEIILLKTKILDNNESIKTIREAAVDELNIDPKMLKVMVDLYFNNNFDQKLEEVERLELLLNTLMQSDK